jgi:hypothetical protein
MMFNYICNLICLLILIDKRRANCFLILCKYKARRIYFHRMHMEPGASVMVLPNRAVANHMTFQYIYTRLPVYYNVQAAYVQPSERGGGQASKQEAEIEGRRADQLDSSSFTMPIHSFVLPVLPIMYIHT